MAITTSMPVCKFWLKGNCKFGSSCYYLHPDKKAVTATKRIAPAGVNKLAPNPAIKKTSTAAKPATKRIAPIEKKSAPIEKETLKKSAPIEIQIQKVADTETLIESFSGPFSNLANLQGHTKEVTGIVLPTGSDKLYTASRDGTLRIWNCCSGECVSVQNLGGEIGCLFTEGNWVFASVPNLIKAWNISSNEEPVSLKHSFGQVYAMETNADVLFSGTQEGSILAWKVGASGFKLEASMKGHSRGVLCLTIGRGKLYSGSVDKTIRVWDMKTFRCLHELKGHNGHVTSLLCWDTFLISSSLDKKLLAWGYEGENDIVVAHSRQEEDGIVTICGMNKADCGQVKDVLFCSLQDKSVRLYDLPSFAEKGKICRNEQVKAIKTGPGNLFFTGDGNGKVSVWNWASNGA